MRKSKYLTKMCEIKDYFRGLVPLLHIMKHRKNHELNHRALFIHRNSRHKVHFAYFLKTDCSPLAKNALNVCFQQD